MFQRDAWQSLQSIPPTVAEHSPNDTCKTDPVLAAVIEAWPELPEAINRPS
jgi:hypothetical protein